LRYASRSTEQNQNQRKYRPYSCFHTEILMELGDRRTFNFPFKPYQK
jgi:hypothetical protein